MRYLTTILKKMMPKDVPKPLGRWSMETCNIKMDNKIDLSNEDHCGSCGQYALKMMETEKIEIRNSNEEK